MLNQEMRTVTMSRSDMCRIRSALTSAMFQVEADSKSRKFWEDLRDRFIQQIEEQDTASEAEEG